MKGRIYIVALLLVMSAGSGVQVLGHNPLYHNGPGPVMKAEPEAITPEEQQFTYYLYAAQRAIDGAEYDDALALSEFAYRLKPKDPTINYFLGVLYEGTHREEEALTHYRVAYEGSPDEYWYRYFALLSRAENEQLQRQAVKLIEKEAKRQADNADVQDTYQKVLLSKGKFKKALQVQDRIDKIVGKSPYSVLQRYRILMVQGKAKEALQVIENYSKEEPDDDFFQAKRGDIYLSIGQREKAEEIYESALRSNPDNPYVLHSLMLFYKQENRPAEERKVLESMMVIAPSDAVYDRYFELLTADSTVSQDEQIAFVQKVYLMEPNNAKWHYYWGLALAQQDSLNAALEVLEEGIRLGEKQPVERFSMHVLCGDLYMRAGQLDSCFSHYEKALVLDPENVYVLNNYAYTLATNGGDLKKAEKMSQKTIEKEPNNATYLDTYAWILHLQGQNSLAKFYMLRAMEKAGEAAEDEELKQHYKILFEQDENKEE